MRRRSARRLTAAGAALAVGLLSVACSSQIQGTAQPGAGPASTTTTTSAAPSGLLESQPFAGSGFTIRAPRGWNVDRSGALGADVIFRNPRADPIGTGSFAANINILSPPASGTLDDVVQSLKSEINRQLPDFQVVDDEAARTTSGLDAYFYGGTFTQTAQLAEQLRDLRLIVLDGTTAYVISGTTLASTYSRYEPAIRASLLSFAASP